MSKKTKIYHITYTPEIKEICLFFWGCNMECRGCYCQRRIFSPMLPDFLGKHVEEPAGLAAPPQRFLDMDELFAILDGYSFDSVLLEGQEASLDPLYSRLTRDLHERYHCRNVLLSNCLELPDLSHTDRIEVGLKAVTDTLHRDYTGVSNAPILANIRRIQREGIPFFVECCFIPGYIDNAEIENIARFIADLDPTILLVLLPYFKSGSNPWRRPTPEEMEQAAAVARQHLTNIFFFKGDEELKYEVLSAFPRLEG